MKWLAAAVALATTLAYPPAAPGPDSSTLFGEAVPDPYRWMESVDSPQTRAWSTAENALTRSYLDGMPLRDALRQRLDALWRYQPAHLTRFYGTLRAHRGMTGAPKRVVFFARYGEAGNDRIVLDPAGALRDGSIAVDSAKFSPDGRYVAFAATQSGSASIVWRVRDLRAMSTRKDRVTSDSSSSATWTPDGRGFYYDTVTPPVQKKIVIRVLYHRLGEQQAADRTVFAFPTAVGSTLEVKVTSDGRWVFMTARAYDGDPSPRLLYRDTAVKPATIRELFAKAPGEQDVLDSLQGSVLVRRRDGSCTSSCIDAVDPQDPSRYRVLVPDDGHTIDAAAVVGNAIFLAYMVDAHSSIVEFDAAGRRIRTLHLPGIGTVDAYGFRDDGSRRYLLATFSSYADPPTVLRYNASTGKGTVEDRTAVGYEPAQYVTEQRFFSSLDGTRVPMFIAHLRTIALDGANPTILYVYAGYGHSEVPVWTPEIVSWLSFGGVYAVVNARGGGEYGEAWHRAGSGLEKQHSIDDLIAAAKELARGGYADSAHLAVRGDSNGGFVAAAAAVQQPDMFRALITREGLLDLVRYDDMLHFAYWTGEFGSKTANAAEAENIVRLSPVAAVRPGIAYPAALIQTGDADTVVSPAHSFKFVATLQADQAGPNPILLRIDHDVGHGAGEPLSKVIDESVDQYSFLLHLMGVTRLSAP